MNEALRVLMVEDSPSDAKLVLRELSRMDRVIDCVRVETAAAMREALDGRTWDVVISDWSMPTFSAPAALRIVNERALDVPFIIVSGTIGEETAVEAMRAGACDYVLKDNLGRLTPAIERELRDFKERAARRKAERALRESEGRFQRLSEAGIIGIMMVDLEGKILDANDAFLAMVGYTREELLRGDLRWSDLTPRELAPLAASAAEQVQRTGAARPWETESIRKDGSRVPMLVGMAMLEYPRCIAFAADLTERRRAEEGRRRAEDALRQSEEQLRHSQKMEAVGRLAGGVAHDFNNLLSVILGYGELMLADTKGTDPLRDGLEEIHKAAGRAAALTRQLLLFSRQPVVEPRVIDLHEVLVGMETMLRRLLGEDVELALVAPKASGRIHVDPSCIEQVIMNLVVNARDAMPTGGKLTLETTNIVLDEDYARLHVPAKAGPYVVMAVSDSGMGMDSATQARIFEPFFTTKGPATGTGLGLSIVFGIVQQSGGNIWVYSEVGKGTTFKIYLPRVDAELDGPRELSAPTTLQGTETILLVEDEEQVRAIVLSILRRQGYQVLPAANAGEALLLCERHAGPLDLLLTDVVMPHMSGPDLATRLKSNQPKMKVLFMSGYTDESIVRHGVLEAGAAFLQKPITPALLARRLREVLDEGRTAVDRAGS